MNIAKEFKIHKVILSLLPPPVMLSLKGEATKMLDILNILYTALIYII